MLTPHILQHFLESFFAVGHQEPLMTFLGYGGSVELRDDSSMNRALMNAPLRMILAKRAAKVTKKKRVSENAVILFRSRSGKEEVAREYEVVMEELLSISYPLAQLLTASRSSGKRSSKGVRFEEERWSAIMKPDEVKEDLDALKAEEQADAVEETEEKFMEEEMKEAGIK